MNNFIPTVIVFSFVYAVLKKNNIIPVYISNHDIKDFINRNLLFQNLDPSFKLIIQKHFKNYNRLSEKDKILFEKRVHKFMNMKEFIPKGDLKEITDEMKVMISSTAIQITFGYPSVYFSSFNKILLYPDNYYSTITKQHHQGEVNMNGIIVLSWTNFVEGFKNDTNGRNLGYHEMAHALKLENALRNDEYNFLDYDLLVEFTGKSLKEIKKINSGETIFFRKYAATNTHEFMAVVVENFFERPLEFREHDPALYELTSKLLKQDPLKRQENYAK